MTADIEIERDETETVAQAPSPRLRDFMWQPRWAKVWWAASFVHWAGMVLAIGVRPLDHYYNTVFAGWLSILLYPPFMLAFCGVSLLWAKILCGEWEFTETPDHMRFSQLSDGGLSDPYTDPLDPRSGAMHLRHIGVYED